MLGPALRITAALATLLSPSLAPAQSYELVHDWADEQRRAVCFGRQATVQLLKALHSQMSLIGKSYQDAAKAMYGVEARSVTNQDGTVCTRQIMGDEV